MALGDPHFAADSRELAAALVAGRWQIVRRLGAGGMGRVYEAHDNVLGERVAIDATLVAPGAPSIRVAPLATPGAAPNASPTTTAVLPVSCAQVMCTSPMVCSTI